MRRDKVPRDFDRQAKLREKRTPEPPLPDSNAREVTIVKNISSFLLITVVCYTPLAFNYFAKDYQLWILDLARP